MALITDSFYLDLILTLPPILYLIYFIVKYNDDYWDKRGVPNLKKGLFWESVIGKKSQADGVIEMYNHFPDEKFVGLFQFKRPMLMVRDLDLIHKVLVKDFTYFQDRGQPEFKHDPTQQSLFSLKGQIWRTLRHKLTPTFTTGKLRGMFEQIAKSGDNMNAKIVALSDGRDVETKSFLFEFTLDVIASCAFGLQFTPDSPEFNHFRDIVQQIFMLSPLRLLRFAAAVVSPKMLEYFDIKSMPASVVDYFLNLTRSTLNHRKENNVKRNDYFQLLMTLKEQEESGKVMGLSASDATEDDEVINQMQFTEQDDQPLSSNIKLMTEEMICSNSFIFLVAGSESTATTISYTLLQLAQHPDIQLRLQNEIDNALAQHGGWNYDAVKQMTYLDQVIQETQRIYPLISLLIRECVKPYKVPDSNLVIEKGVLIGIPVIGLQRDPQNYPDPLTFNPDRFEGNNFKPNPTFMPFGDGPRICIAMRFAVLEVKVCVARIMSQYSVKVSPKMKFPLKFNKRAFVPTIEGGVWLNFEKRKSTSIKK